MSHSYQIRKAHQAARDFYAEFRAEASLDSVKAQLVHAALPLETDLEREAFCAWLERRAPRLFKTLSVGTLILGPRASAPPSVFEPSMTALSHAIEQQYFQKSLRQWYLFSLVFGDDVVDRALVHGQQMLGHVVRPVHGTVEVDLEVRTEGLRATLRFFSVNRWELVTTERSPEPPLGDPAA